MAETAGRRAVEMALAGGPKPAQILTAQAFDNAIAPTWRSIGGSTNVIIHLVAIAGRVGVLLPLERHGKLFLDYVLQANEGVDFDYLKGRTPVRFEDTAGPSHS